MAGSNLKIQQITNFTSGEFSPQLAGRVDLEAFGGSARKISNFLVEVTGGLKKFYGSLHCAEIDTPIHIKMVPFINKYEQMVLVIHDGSVGLLSSRWYRELNFQIPVTSGYDKLRWRQINDRILFVHPTVQPFAIDFFGISEADNDYVFYPSNIEFEEVPYFPIGFTGDYNGKLITSGSAGVITASIPDAGITALLEFPYPVATASSYIRLDDIFLYGASGDSYSVPDAAVIELYRVRAGETTKLLEGTASSTTVTSSTSPYSSSNATTSTSLASSTRASSIRNPSVSTGSTSITMVYKRVMETVSRELILKAVQAVFPKSVISRNYLQIIASTDSDLQEGDELYFTISFNPYTRYASKNDPTDFSLEAETYNTLDKLSIVANNKLPDANLVGRKIKFYTNTDAQIYPWYAEEQVQSKEIRYSNGSYYQATGDGTCGKQQPSHLSGTMYDGGVYWKYLHSGSASGTITAINSEATQITVQLNAGDSLPALSASQVEYDNFAWSIWGHNGIHPSDIYFVQNRLGMICNTESFGAWNAMSVSDKYLDFSTEQYGQQLDTSAIVHLVVNNPDNKINWVLSYNALYMGSDTTEFSVTANGSVFTPTSLMCNPVSSLGGAAVVPLKYKELNLFVGSKKDELYTIGYDYTIEDYVPKSIGYITNHLLEQGINRLEGFNNKDQVVYILHDSGELSVLNYVMEQSILAYSHIDAGAKVVDFCTTSSGSSRVAYMAVARNDGKLSLEFISDEEPTYMWNTFDYVGDSVNDVTVPELANQNVFIIIDGQFIETTLDENGQYLLSEPTDHYSVGIKMVSELHTQPAFGVKMQGLAQQSVKVSLRLNESGAFKYGDSTNFDKYIDFSNWGTDQELGAPHNLYTGDAMLDLASGYMAMANEGKGPYPNDTGIGVNIKAETPEPFNILSINEVYV